AENVTVCNNHGLIPVTYEGGPHILGGSSAERRDNADYRDFLYNCNRHSRMHDSY
ncbi:MAG: hypothetical protein GTN78_26320, partial [Gemmatimonadales bacterium]|nr:hypothetical protein [Gemmatimonadales bacterium]